MNDYTPFTPFICVDLAIGWQSCTELTIDRTYIEGAVVKDRTWNGRAVTMSDPAFDLMSVVIKASGPGEMRPPALDHVQRLPSFQAVPSFILPDIFYTGETMRTLARDPHPGSIRVLTLGFEDVPFTVDGRVVTLLAPAPAVLRIYYRPVLELTVWEPLKETTVEGLAEVSWELPCQEVGGPDE